MSHSGWRALLATFVMLALNSAKLLGAPLPANDVPSRRAISFRQFRNMVRAGKEVRGRVVPAGYILCVLQNADNLLKESSHASLRLVSSQVTSGTIEPKGPTRDIHTYSQEVQKHLGDREKKQAVYLGLPIEISNTDFHAKLYLNAVVVEKRITLEDVDFHESVYFQGAVFEEQLVLKRTRFHGVTDFSGAFLPVALSFKDCEFESQANFANLNIPKGSALYIGGGRISVPLDLSGSRISGTVTLEGLEKTLEIHQIFYLNGINAEPDVPAGELYLRDIVLHDNVYMDRSQWVRLDLAESEDGRHRPIRFLGFCDLRQGLFDTVNLAGAEFDRGGDFSGSRFRTVVSFERTKLRQPIRMSWEQLEGKLGPVLMTGEISRKEAEKRLSRQSYEELERNFGGLGDIDSQNACNYEKRWNYEGVNIPWLISGYWVKPWVTLCWILLSLPLIYYINKKLLGKQWFGLRQAAVSKAHLMSEPWSLTVQSTFRLLLPKEYWGTVKGQRLYLLESLWMKFFLGILLFTLKNTSPLLRELLPYLLPK